jgi:hypothetical protein
VDTADQIHRRGRYRGVAEAPRDSDKIGEVRPKRDPAVVTLDSGGVEKGSLAVARKTLHWTTDGKPYSATLG